jgi:hypothetical protein
MVGRMRPRPVTLVAVPFVWGVAFACVNLAVSAWATATYQQGDVVFHPRSGLWQLSGLVATVAVSGFAVYLREARLVRGAMAIFLGGIWANTFAPFLWPAGVPDFIRSPFDPYLFFNTADVSLWIGAGLFMVGAYLHLHEKARRDSGRRRRRRRSL